MKEKKKINISEKIFNETYPILKPYRPGIKEIEVLK